MSVSQTEDEVSTAPPAHAEGQSGLRGVLQYALMFDLLQRVMGFPYKYAANQITAQLPPRDTATSADPPIVLDIGCGTARVLKYIDGVRYIGLEPSEKYVAAARAHFPNTEFLPVAFQDLDRSDLLARVDVVVAIGVLHHITDVEVVELARISAETLKPAGTFMTLDPAFVREQHGVAKLLARSDRGEHVRTPAHLGSLVGQVFPNVETEVRNDLRRFPYTHVVVRAKAQRP